jgi:AcrR family transcriptional regulator
VCRWRLCRWWPLTEQEPDASERILDTATRLFAALGYDGTAIEVIADATGYAPSTITALVGDKQTLYRAVMDRAQARQRAMYDAMMVEFTPDLAGLHLLTDRALDYCVDHPEVIALWAHRWQSDAADISELEKVYIWPEIKRFRAMLNGIAPAGTDVDLAWLSVAWSIRGFCLGGVVNSEGVREGPDDPILLERFRRHLHRLIGRLFEMDR